MTLFNPNLSNISIVMNDMYDTPVLPSLPLAGEVNLLLDPSLEKGSDYLLDISLVDNLSPMPSIAMAPAMLMPNAD